MRAIKNQSLVALKRMFYHINEISVRWQNSVLLLLYSTADGYIYYVKLLCFNSLISLTVVSHHLSPVHHVSCPICTPARCQVKQMNSSGDMWRTYRQVNIQRLLPLWRCGGRWLHTLNWFPNLVNEKAIFHNQDCFIRKTRFPELEKANLVYKINGVIKHTCAYAWQSISF